MVEETEEEMKYLFCWDDVPGDDSERLRRFLNDDFNLNLPGDVTFEKVDDMAINTNGGFPKIIIDENKKKATLEIGDGRTLELKVKEENNKLYIYKKKEVYVLIKIKPKYAEEFCIMMVACKGLCDRASESKNLAQIAKVFSVLGPFDFLLALCGEGKNDKEIKEKINKTLFKIRETLGSYIYETCTLTKFELSKYLDDDARNCLTNAGSFQRNDNQFKNFFEKLNTQVDQEGTKTFDSLCKLKEELDTAEQETAARNEIITKDVHVLIKIKPEYTEKFFVAITICKNLFDGASVSQNLAKITTFFSVLGPFDFLLKIIGAGREEKIDEKINRTLLKIRETLGSYINETLTITKFRIPITKEELEKFFEEKLGVKKLVKVPGKRGETIPPDENLKSDANIDLEEIYDAETTPLKNLLEKAKTFLEPEDLNERINELAKHVEELEKRR